MPPYHSLPPPNGAVSVHNPSDPPVKPQLPVVYNTSPFNGVSQTRTPLNMPGLPVSVPFVLPSTANLNLPVYSTSGFDILSLLARVATRPHPKITLGPVDMTCSFVVVDVRRYDHPIVYCSSTFCELTGYSEEDIIGRNCRFLQAPDGLVEKGEQRLHTSPEAVAHMRKSLVADKECQVNLINYRKNGDPFVNRVTVIPIPGGVNNAVHEAEDVVYQIGFQVDLGVQPAAILQKVRDGSYMVNHTNNVVYPSPLTTKGFGASSSATAGVSKQFRALLNKREFVQSIPLSTDTTTLSLAPEERHDPYDGNRLLSLMLLETAPDAIFVMSLKGTFLYVSPSIRHVLGYDPEDLVGKGVTDFCYDADKVPLIRELKESSSGPSTQGLSPPSALSSGPSLTSQSSADDATSQQYVNGKFVPSHAGPRNVDLLFRMLAKDDRYVWMECSGRLYSEPGKGRKAIILSGRVRHLPSLRWDTVGQAGGLTPSRMRDEDKPVERECWALLSEGGSFLYASEGVRQVLGGWGPAEVIGRALTEFVGGGDQQLGRAAVREALQQVFAHRGKPGNMRSLSCHLQQKDGTEVPVDVVLYHPEADESASAPVHSAERPLVCQIRFAQHVQPAEMAHPSAEDVFMELDPARASGWQYELQQLKYANHRLADQVEALETRIEEKEADVRLRTTYLQRFSQNPTAPPNTWANHLMTHAVSPSLKRSWDGNLTQGGGRT